MAPEAEVRLIELLETTPLMGGQIEKLEPRPPPQADA